MVWALKNESGGLGFSLGWRAELIAGLSVHQYQKQCSFVNRGSVTDPGPPAVVHLHSPSLGLLQPSDKRLQFKRFHDMQTNLGGVISAGRAGEGILDLLWIQAPSVGNCLPSEIAWTRPWGSQVSRCRASAKSFGYRVTD